MIFSQKYQAHKTFKDKDYSVFKSWQRQVDTARVLDIYILAHIDICILCTSATKKRK
jgi:hypothetical protein